MLVLAIAGLPALAATAGMGDDHAGHMMHAGAHDDAGEHAHHPASGDDGAQDDHHADCTDAVCLAACSACGHCQGVPSLGNVFLPGSATEGQSLNRFHGGPSAAARYRPPTLS